MIEMRLLKNALMLAEHGNYARAAQALNISQPTLSRSIQLLEKTVGDRLFDRKSKHVTPTKAGEIVLKHARILLSSSRALQEEIAGYQGLMEGSVSVGAGPYAASALVAPAMGQFIKRHPGIDICVSVDDWSRFPERLMQNDFDFAVMESSQLDTERDFELIPLKTHQVFFYCRAGHPLLEKEHISMDTLYQFHLIVTTLPKRIERLLDELAFPNKESGTQERKQNRISCNDLATIKAIIAHSDGIGLGTYGTLAFELGTGAFVMLPFHVPELKTHYNIVTRKGLSLSPSALAFIEIMRETDREQLALESGLAPGNGLANRVDH